MTGVEVSRLKSRIYLAVGFTMVGLGIAGIPTPILPTTPFLLLAAYCFARSSPRWHEWLVSHRVLGPFIAAFREKKGLTVSQKRRIALAVTMTLLVTAFFTPWWPVKALAAFIWVTGMTGLYFARSAPESRKAREVSS